MKKFLAILITVCFGLFFQQNVFALSDLSETYSDGNSHVICASGPGWNNLTSCEGYNYIIIENIDMTNTSSYLAWNASYNFGDIRLAISNKVIINKPLQTGDYIRFGISNYSSGSYKITLAQTLDTSEPCPEPEPCPDCETPPFVQIVVDAFWKYHVAFAAAVPAILVIFLVYRLIKGRLR